jgi:hypothetical protein
MAEIVIAPYRYISDDKCAAKEWSIFLAGAIDMGAAVDWQAQVIERLCDIDNLVIYNPRREQFTPDTLGEQIEWELEHLEKVDTIFMWLPKDAKAPISFFEAGLYWRSGKLLIGAEPGFYRRRNLEITGARYGTFVYQSLDEMVQSLLRSLPRSAA